MHTHAYTAVHNGSAIFLISWSLLSEDVATTVSPGLAASTASKPYWSVVFLVGSIDNWGWANAAVTSVREEAAAGNYIYIPPP